MARTSDTVTQQEIQSYVKFCKDYNVVNYDGRDPETLANADFILHYFLEVWKQDMSEANFALAFSQLKPHLKFYSSPQHAEYTHIANENIQAAQQLVAWLNTQGKAGQLANSGDDAYENLTLLLTELRDRREDVSSKTIRDAEDRIAHRTGRKLNYVQAPRREMGTITEAARNDDGVPFLGRNPNEPAWVKRSRERAEREAAEQAERAKQSGTVSSVAAREAKEKAESLQGGTHAETDQLRKIFVTSGTEIDWKATFASRLQMQAQFDKQRAVRRFIR
jgi:hypothetical protein